jgi:hypothetical protein
MQAPPQMTPARSQSMRALRRANRVRTARAELKRGVAVGERDVGEVILHCPREALGMTVSELLMSQPRWGAIRSRKVLALLPISESKSLGSMTDRQSQALAALLEAPIRG